MTSREMQGIKSEGANNPEGVAAQSPGLRYSATLGHAVNPRRSWLLTNPEGVAPCNISRTVPPNSLVNASDTTPLGLGTRRHHYPG